MEKKEVKATTLAKYTRDAMGQAGIPHKFRAASLRHAAISWWLSAGVPLDEVMRRTGHWSASLVRKFYDRTVDKDIIMSLLKDESSDKEISGEPCDDGGTLNIPQTLVNGSHE